MKQASMYTKRLASFLRQIKKHHAEPWAPLDPVTQLILGFLQWNATRKSAQTAHDKLRHALVDHNELRVSHPQEVVAIIGPRYPQAEERAARLHDVLQAVFDREHAVSLSALEKKSRKDVRAYLDSLPGMVPYVAAQVSILSFGGLAVPLDDATVALLKTEELVDPEAPLEQIAAFLERQIKAEDAPSLHLHLRAWADAQFGKKSAAPAMSKSGEWKPTPKKH